MAKFKRMTFSLSEDMVAELLAAVQAGEFASTSEAVREALRQWQRSRTIIALNDEALKALVKKGRESGEPISGEGALRRLRRKYAVFSDEPGR